MPQKNRVERLLRDEGLVEELAAIEHERWSHWQRYLHDQCEQGADGSLTIPPHLVRRWATQMTTPHAELSEAEKDSERDQVERYLPIIERALGAECRLSSGLAFSFIWSVACAGSGHGGSRATYFDDPAGSGPFGRSSLRAALPTTSFTCRITST